MSEKKSYPSVTFVLVMLLSGCSEYIDRREGISIAGGDAVRANIAVHVIDPWAAGAHKRSTMIDSERQTARARTFNAGIAAPAGGGNGAAGEIETQAQ